MRSLMILTENCIGRGLRTPRQLLMGLAAAEQKSPAVRLTLKQRKSLKKRDVAANSQSKHPTARAAYRAETWDTFNYVYDSRLAELMLNMIRISDAPYLA